MSDGPKIKALPNIIPNVKFNLEAQEQFGNARGIRFEHWSAIPSPIGLKDRGDYRRSDTLDTISENGFIYEKVGCFVATIVGNSHSNQQGVAEAGIYDNSTARIVIPKFYSDQPDREIKLLPGDRVYAAQIELKVENYQRAEYTPTSSDFLQFPAKKVSRLVDSQGISYKQNKHFRINKDGNIKWIAGQKNPGIDPDTGKGRVYSIRYEYIAFWYVQQLVNEIRVTNTEDADTPQRMPYHAVVQREYVYHKRVRGSDGSKGQGAEDKPSKKNITSRTNKEPEEKLDQNSPKVRVDIRNFTE